MPPTDATRFLEVLRRQLARDADHPKAVAYSGGRDSGTLLWALAQLYPPESLTALHVDHGWRPDTERAAERELVADWCRRLAVPLVTFAPPAIAPFTEAEARRHRYQCLESWSHDHPQGVIYLAHHADDQAETILMRLLKGRSWNGLAGIPEQRGPFRRPLLWVRAAVIHRVAAEQSIPWHQDSTNESSGPARNFLRNEVFPLLTSRWPRAVEALVELGDLWRAERPIRGVDPAWNRESEGGSVAAAVWDRWTPRQRQDQLLALATLRAGPVSRRFLEAVCADGRRGAARGQGWFWRRGREVSWRTIAPPPSKEYFIVAQSDRWYRLGAVRWSWSRQGGDLFLAAVDGDRPWVWRSATKGLALGSVDELQWSRERRKRYLAGRAPEESALVVQDGLVRAVIDVPLRRLIWTEPVDPVAETAGEKLHKGGIFVTLVTVTRNLTE